jgi:hypothetical protein
MREMGCLSIVVIIMATWLWIRYGKLICVTDMFPGFRLSKILVAESREHVVD